MLHAGPLSTWFEVFVRGVYWVNGIQNFTQHIIIKSVVLYQVSPKQTMKHLKSDFKQLSQNVTPN